MARQTALPVPLQIIAGFGALIGVAAGEVPIGLDGGGREGGSGSGGGGGEDRFKWGEILSRACAISWNNGALDDDRRRDERAVTNRDPGQMKSPRLFAFAIWRSQILLNLSRLERIRIPHGKKFIFFTPSFNFYATSSGRICGLFRHWIVWRSRWRSDRCLFHKSPFLSLPR